MVVEVNVILFKINAWINLLSMIVLHPSWILEMMSGYLIDVGSTINVRSTLGLVVN